MTSQIPITAGTTVGLQMTVASSFVSALTAPRRKTPNKGSFPGLATVNVKFDPQLRLCYR
ncbi:hypothetical protein BDY24DRAFT_414919 [Mrakia frigida]|uniref:uncharacterized protein n=1 Tax=Mrakia frigida TaxID=29902 RepID=UPI003FCC1164